MPATTLVQMSSTRRARFALVWLIAAVAAACTSPGSGEQRSAVAPTNRDVATAPSSPDEATAEGDKLPKGVSEPPPWLGERVLPRGPDGFGVARRTPRLLRDRRLRTVDFLAPPTSSRFSSSIRPLSETVLNRSTWRSACPVDAKDLSYVTVTFWGFDRRPHTGELIVNHAVARDVVSVFKKLHNARWPIEEMRVTATVELDAPPTGDGNNTGAFVCRPSRSSSEWSEHAFGLAIDINPFQNPYVRGDLVLPELAGAYRNRRWRRPGMIYRGDVVTRSFSRIGWSWGGDWTFSKDWMHFSLSGR